MRKDDCSPFSRVHYGILAVRLESAHMPDDDHRTDEPLERVLDSSGRRQQFAARVRDIPLLATVDGPRVVPV